MRWNQIVLPCLMMLAVLATGCLGDKDIETDLPDDEYLGDPGLVLGSDDVLDGEYAMSGSSFADDPTLTEVQGVEFSAVLFGYDSFQLAPREMAKVDEVAAYMNQDRGTKLIVQGHCDERGSREYNLALGDRRALTVRTYLINLGIDAMRVQTQSYGEEMPLDPGHNEAAWRLNRRAEFKLFR